MYATQLGDDRPNAGGYWLKTLYTMSKARVWWATTDAHEEYEDELLTQFAARATADDAVRERTLGLPFANLLDTGGRPKTHGLENALREAAAATPVAAPATKTRKAAAPRRPAVRRGPIAKTEPPQPAPAYVSVAGADELNTELEHLRNRGRPGRDRSGQDGARAG